MDLTHSTERHPALDANGYSTDSHKSVAMLYILFLIVSALLFEEKSLHPSLHAADIGCFHVAPIGFR